MPPALAPAGGRVVVDLADARQRRSPTGAGRCRCRGAEHVDALDDEPAVDDLRLRAVAVARQDAVVRRAAEPEQAERRLDELVLRDARVGGVGVLVGPVGRRRAAAPSRVSSTPVAALSLHRRLGQSPPRRQPRGKSVRSLGGERQAGDAAVGPQRGERLLQERRRQSMPAPAGLRDDHQAGEVRRQLRRVAGRRRCTATRSPYSPAAIRLSRQRRTLCRVRLDDDDVQAALPGQLGDEPAGADAPGDAVAVAHAGRVEDARGPARSSRRPARRRGPRAADARLRLARSRAEAVDAAFARDDEQPVVRGDAGGRRALDRRLPGDAAGSSCVSGRSTATTWPGVPSVEAGAGLDQRLDAAAVGTQPASGSVHFG